MDASTKEHYDGWKEKYESIEGDSLNSVFERFTTIYTIYNRLYVEVYKSLKAKGNHPKKANDRYKATVLILDFLTPELILKKLQEKGLDGENASIAHLIKNKVFHINLDEDGNEQEDIDEQLQENLLSDDAEIRTRATLSTIYNIRCNLHHGRKDFEEHQRLLLQPTTSILEVIVDMLYNKLIEL